MSEEMAWTVEKVTLERLTRDMGKVVWSGELETARASSTAFMISFSLYSRVRGKATREYLPQRVRACGGRTRIWTEPRLQDDYGRLPML